MNWEKTLDKKDDYEKFIEKEYPNYADERGKKRR